MFVRTLASFRSGQWSISWFKSSVSDLLFSIRHTHAQPKSESGVHKQLDGISFLCPPIFTISWYFPIPWGSPFLDLHPEPWGCIHLPLSYSSNNYTYVQGEMQTEREKKSSQNLPPPPWDNSSCDWGSFLTSWVLAATMLPTKRFISHFPNLRRKILLKFSLAVPMSLSGIFFF